MSEKNLVEKDLSKKTLSKKHLSKKTGRNVIEPANKCDSIHGLFEQQVRRQKFITDMDEYETVIRSSGSRIEVVRMTQFFQFTKMVRVGGREQLPKLQDIVEVYFEKQSPRVMYFKKSFSDAVFYSVYFLKRGADLSLPPSKEVAKLISEKQDHYKKSVMPIIPENRRVFWENGVIL